jgi:hypothetical protein
MSCLTQVLFFVHMRGPPTMPRMFTPVFTPARFFSVQSGRKISNKPLCRRRDCNLLPIFVRFTLKSGYVRCN